ncbi:MAG: hypothetical protein IT518_16845 [Burkholderiales bacterium]|nr:hypothetical protein [Burkholderiales bacterium]
MTAPSQTHDEVSQAASDSMRAGVDIRQRIHDLTLLALRNRRFDRHGMQEVVRAVTDGVAHGAEQSQADLRQSLSEAFRGMDLALKRSAEAGGTALRQLATTGKDLSDNEIKQALANMKRLEDDFLTTAGRAAEATSERIRPELKKILSSARETGTETGRIAAHTMADLGQRFSVASIDVAIAGMQVAAEVGGRFAQVAGGILSGIADALATKPADKKPPTT